MAEEGVAASGGNVVANEDKLRLNDDGMLYELASDYAGYVNPEYSTEKLKFHEVIDDLLTKLDEYISAADLVRSDNSLALQSTMGNIQTKSRELQKHFDRIDRLEAFMTVVKRNVAELELAVDKAESEMGMFGSIKKAFNSVPLPSLFTPKTQTVRHTVPASPVYQPVAIFQTSQFFPKQPSADMPPDETVSPVDVMPGQTGADVQTSDSATATSAAAVEMSGSIASAAAEAVVPSTANKMNDADSTGNSAKETDVRSEEELVGTNQLVDAVFEIDGKRERVQS